MKTLNWPEEGVWDDAPVDTWSAPGSNRILDFHGDPQAAQLVVFSDGNHHMALMPSLRLFKERFPQVGDIFYATTPPGPILRLLRHGRLKIGNFILSVIPHLFISPPHVLDTLVTEGRMTAHWPFMRNRGIALLVPAGNPKRINGVGDLARVDVRLFLSHPKTETVSYQGYVAALKALGARAAVDLTFLDATQDSSKICFGVAIHHREAPEAVAAGLADAAVVYYHLALRYVRIFPEVFEMIKLEAPAGDMENSGTSIHAGLIGDGGQWGRACLDFLFTPEVAEIYAAHGLDAITNP